MEGTGGVYVWQEYGVRRSVLGLAKLRHLIQFYSFIAIYKVII